MGIFFHDQESKHITIGFYMTMIEMVAMMVKFVFASTLAAIIVVFIWLLIFSALGITFLPLQSLQTALQATLHDLAKPQ